MNVTSSSTATDAANGAAPTQGATGAAPRAAGEAFEDPV
jgi:hypothetical protein